MFRKSIFLILLLVFGLTISVASGETVRINFQSRTAGSREVPLGYLPDYGDVFGDRGNGWSYGWNDDKTGLARDRDSYPDQRYDTFNHLSRWGSVGQWWEIALPNSIYNVYIVGGDPSYSDQTTSYLVEGIEVIDTTPYPPGNPPEDKFDEYNVTVTVADGGLTIENVPGADLAKVCFIHIADVRVAQLISPPDRSLWPSTTALLEWTPGTTAAQHDVYLGTDFNDVNEATDPNVLPGRGRQDANSYSATGLIPGTTYYWRIDEVNEPNVWKGDIWIFEVQLLTAYDPQPIDGAIFVDPNVVLSWTPGASVNDVNGHRVYLDLSEAKVQAKSGCEVNGVETTDPCYTILGLLMLGETYYWAVDEVNEPNIWPGEVWSFKTAPRLGGGLMGRYYNNTSWTEPPVLIRIDPQIDFDWGLSSPDPCILPDDNFSVRWIGQIEIPAFGEWTFWTQMDNTGRLWVNGQLLIDEFSWVTAWYSAPITLEAGFYPIVMEYLDTDNIALVRLLWQSPLVPTRQIIPTGAFTPPFAASSPYPANGAIGVRQTPTLRWTAGYKATYHNVYFGDDEAAVEDADTTTTDIYRGQQVLDNTKYTPIEAPLEWNKTYYWRIYEVNEFSFETWEGNVWSFTTADYIILDDFEDYNDACDRIFFTWTDGAGHSGSTTCGIAPSLGNGTGSMVGWGKKPYVEQLTIHSGGQSMPLFYDNSASPHYSEAVRTWETPQDWTAHDVAALIVWFHGIRAAVGGITYDSATNTYTMTGSGEDIWDITDPREVGYHDEFHFAYKQLSGAGSIIAKLESLTNTDAWAKAGVMIRDSLDANSVYAMVAVTPENGVTFQYRIDEAGVTTTMEQADVNAPHWVKLTRPIANTFTAQHSADGQNWVDVEGDLPSTIDIPMNPTTYIGLALTSHDALATGEAVFSNVSATGTGTGTVTPTGPFTQSQDIGIESNAADRLYVILEDNDGNSLLVEHPEPNATQIYEWQDFNIDMREFTNAGVNTAAITKMTLGVGNKAAPVAAGGGTMYFDEIRVSKPGCFASVSKPEADLSNNCVVDEADLEILASEWLSTATEGIELVADLDDDGDVDFGDYAELASTWLEELLWPQL